ncbi:hypothetical protein, partial [Motilibacter deserti]
DAFDAEVEKVTADPTTLQAAWKENGLSAPTIDFLKTVPVSDLLPVDAAAQQSFQTEADFWADQKVIPSSVDVKASSVDVASLK